MTINGNNLSKFKAANNVIKPITTLNLNNSLPDAPVCLYYLSAISVPDQIPSIFHA